MKRVLLGLIVIGALAGAGLTWANETSRPSPTDGSLSEIAQGPTTFERTMQAFQIEWTLLSYDSDEGPCLEVIGASGRGDRGSVASCGRSDGSFQWSIGGVELAGDWYSIAFGEAPPLARKMETVLGDGSVKSDADLASGKWLVVTRADPFDRALEIAEIRAKDGQGTHLASLQVPSLIDRRERARTLAAKGSTEG